jgi:hypothetical protein
MAMSEMEVTHQLQGRMRVRMPTLRKNREAAREIQGHLAEQSGVHMVEVRPYTGSVLCVYDPEQIDEEKLVKILGGFAEKMPEAVESEDTAEGPSGLACAMADFIQGIDRDVMRKTQGRFDLGMLMSLTFLSAGMLDVIRRGKIKEPPWFNWAWWAFRTFMTTEADAINVATQRHLHDLHDKQVH